MDKIIVGDYLKDYTISDKTPVTISNYAVTEYLYMISPSPQLINWFIARGWGVVSWALTDPSSITDYAYMQKGQFDERRVLQALVDEFTSMFNEGRTINDTRYEEILAILAAVMDKTGDGLNLLETDETTFVSLVEGVISVLLAEYTAHNTDISGYLNSWGDSQRERVDDKYDADSAAKQDSIIDRGFYNTSVWDAADLGIEAERASADLELEDRILVKQLENKRYLYGAQVDIRMKFLEARNRLVSLKHAQGSGRIDLRNKVIDGIAGFAERRTDEYPSFLEPLNATLNVALSQKTQGWA